MSYLELLKLASPEGIVVVTALVVLAIGLTTERASAFCFAIATFGLAIAIGAVLMLPRERNSVRWDARDHTVNVVIQDYLSRARPFHCVPCA